MAAAREFVRRLTGYTIQDDGLLFGALDTSGSSTPQSNRRAALVGDRVLHLVLADEWYSTSATLGDGDIIEKAVAANTHLDRFGRQVGLGAHINVNDGQRGQPIGLKIMAATVEAIIGTIWIDSGKDLNTVRAAIDHMGLKDSAM